MKHLDYARCKQKTISRPISLEGIGLHSGEETNIVISPAPANSGLFFLKDGERIPATVDQVAQTKRGTTLKNIAVTEHLLAAAYGLEIDNLQIEVQGNELPVMDGSALPFVDALETAGIVEQNEEKTSFKLTQKIKVQDNDAWLIAEPYDGLKVDFMVKFPYLGEQKLSLELSPETFKREIAPARTFGYLEEVEELKAQGLARGASEKNALVLGKEGYLNQPRFPDELVRHKILDLFGDIALLGQSLQAAISANKSGHKLNIELVRRLKQL